MSAPGIPGYVQVPLDSTGKKIDTLEVVRADGVTAERQIVAIPDVITVDADMLRLLLAESRLQTFLLATAFGITDDLDTLRDQLTPQI